MPKGFEGLSPKDEYNDLLLAIQKDPHSEDTWQQVVALARAEEAAGSGVKNYYAHVPLEELITVGERLRAAPSREAQYDILAERSSTGERWYDIVLGHVNDKNFAPVATRLGTLFRERGRTWAKGLDLGTGTGNTIRSTAKYFQSVVGVDTLGSVLETVQDQKGFPKNAEVVVGDVTQLPFPDHVFDVAVSNGLTYYLSKPEAQRYVQELARVIKPGGMYIEAWPTKKAGDTLLEVDKEYATSAKALLTYNLDQVVSHIDPAQASSKWSLEEMVATYRSNGFKLRSFPPNEDGVWFIEFHKGK